MRRDPEIRPLPLERFEGVVRQEHYDRLVGVAARVRELAAGHVIWNVNSTSRGGGVAEMLQSLVAYVKGAGIDIRWAVMPGTPEFFTVTKRIHNHLHGAPGDGLDLDDGARAVYMGVLARVGEALASEVKPGDIVILHDPQTAGLAGAMKAAGAHAVWRCHVGVDTPNHLVRGAWRFLTPLLEPADAVVFSRAAYVWEGLDPQRVWLVAPSIDAFSSKNLDLSPDQVQAVMSAAGILAGGSGAAPVLTGGDGREVRVIRRATMIETGPATLAERIVAQISRWDRLKDPAGVIRGFADHVHGDAHLIVAGPEVEGVSDDPEGGQVLAEATAIWADLPAARRSRIHLATLPMEDVDENAIMVNALQRSAAVAVQKSLAEGFGLTVAEAMWKARPVVASRVGGIQEQIEDGRSGLLVDDPADLAEFGRLVDALLEAPARAARIGAAARERVRESFLAPRHLIQYGELFEGLLSRGTPGA